MSEPVTSVPAESEQILNWLREGESRFIGTVDGLTDDELQADSGLPEWSRAHVAAHVARNAEAMSRLLTWALTGEEKSMYPDVESRNRDIATSAGQSPEALRGDVRATSAQFDADVVALPAAAWTARVRTFQGREIPASATLWMRAREVWLHLVDLDAGMSVESWPGELVDTLLDEVTATMSAGDDPPRWLLEATDRERTWQIGGAAGQAIEQEISGKAADLLAWLTGRSAGAGLATEGVLPTPPHWM